MNESTSNPLKSPIKMSTATITLKTKVVITRPFLPAKSFAESLHREMLTAAKIKPSNEKTINTMPTIKIIAPAASSTSSPLNKANAGISVTKLLISKAA